MQSTYAVDVEQLIEQRKLTLFQIVTVVLCACAVLVDGFDTMAIGYVAPAVIKAWNIHREAMTPAFTAGQIGMMIGALCLGPLADRIGRRPVIIGCGIVFGVMSLLTMQTTTIPELLVCRFIGCIGLGGAMPNALALTNEYIPAQIRRTITMVMFCGFSVGAALGGMAAAGLIAQYGWQAVFLIGGIIPLVFSAVFCFYLPESLRYLAVTRRNPQRLARYAARLGFRTDPARGQPEFRASERAVSGSLVRELFADGRSRLTLLLWVIIFVNLLDLNLLSNWLPTLLRDAGLPLRTAALITVGYQIGGTVGALLLGLLFDRFKPFFMLTLIYLLALVAIVGVGLAGAHALPLYLVVFVAGFCVIGGMTAVTALVADCYPTAIRSTGLGWALGIGRVGAIVGPTVGGMVLGMDSSANGFFAVGALPMVLAGAAAWAIHRGARREPLLRPQALEH